jgi:hypothetical protein
MVMCCSNQDHSEVTLVTAAEDVKPGTRVLLEGQQVEEKVFPNILNPKKKLLEKALPDLAVAELEGRKVACFKQSPLFAEKANLISTQIGSIG